MLYKFEIGDQVFTNDGGVGIVTYAIDGTNKYVVDINGQLFYYHYLDLTKEMPIPSTDYISNTPATRPCMVTRKDEEPKRAEFHKWVEDATVFLKFHRQMRDRDMSDHIDNYFKHNILPADNDLEKITNTVALVEFEDGTVKKVDPESVRFIKKRD